MKKEESIGNRAQGGEPERSGVPRSGNRAESRNEVEFRVAETGISVRLSDGVTGRWNDKAMQFGSLCLCVFVLNIRHKISRHKTQDGEDLPMTLIIKKPQQENLPGSRYKSPSCLPQEGFNSGVCPGAATITTLYSCTGSPWGTLGDSRTPSNSQSPVCPPADRKIKHKVMEDLPMI